MGRSPPIYGLGRHCNHTDLGGVATDTGIRSMDTQVSRLTVRSWTRRDRRIIQHWPPYFPALPAHWTQSPVAKSGGQRVFFAVETQGKLIGRVTLHVVESTATLGIVLHPHFLGLGLGTETLQVMQDVGCQRKLTQFRLYVADDNVRAIRCYERVGFRRMGKLGGNAQYLEMVQHL